MRYNSQNKKGLILDSLFETEEQLEKAVMVGVWLGKNNESTLNLEGSLEELAFLAETAGIEVVGEITQNLIHPNPKTYIGSGKVEELKLLVEELGADMILFDDELSPRHQRELEEVFGNKTKVIDRTALILDIFALHADTAEGKLQVELAQLHYRLPRLTRAWTHLARQAGGGAGRTGSVGGVGLRGPGETQLETDRREIQKRITKLEDELEKVRERRARHRSQRKKSNVPIVALVGYTNAGKSTLLNAITNSEIYVADQLFATLDPTIRQLQLPGGTEILVSDTVGFIQKLPTQLVAAFRATLEEIKEADLLLHIVDVSHEHHQEQSYSVLETLREIEAGDIPILTVYNKIDLLDEETLSNLETSSEEMSYFISARTGEGVEALQEAIADELFSEQSLLKVLLPYSEGRLVSIFHERGNVINVEHLEEGILIYGRLPRETRPYFTDYMQ